MSFKLTPEYLNTVLATVREGDMLSFLKFVDPDVEWRLGASDEPGKGHSGVYVSSLLLCRTACDLLDD